MKNALSLLAAIIIACVFNSCKKDKNEEFQLDGNFKQFNSDANNIKSESDQTDNDINTSLSTIPSFGRITPEAAAILSSPLCGVTIDSSQIANKILFYNFDGVTPCFSPSRTRSGQIKVQLTSGSRWSDAGAQLTLTYTNFKITRLSDNKYIIFNGTKTLTNVNGNDWLGFLAGTSTLKYRERALNVQVGFNSASAVWNSARITEWRYTPTAANPSQPLAYVTFTAKGDTTVNGFANTDSWGTNRFGQNFTTYYITPVVSNTYCGLWRFNAGQLIHNVNGQNFTLTLGVDQNGNPTPNNCAYGFKVEWVANGNTRDVVLSY